MIVDDEEPARSLVREFLSAHGDVAVLPSARTASGREGRGRDKPDVLLDVQMPRLDGFEVLELVEK